MKTLITLSVATVAIQLSVALLTDANAENAETSAPRVRAIQADLKSIEADLAHRHGEVTALVVELLDKLELSKDERARREGAFKGTLSDLITAAQRQGALQHDLNTVGTL